MKKNIAQKIVSNLFHLFTLAFLFLWCGNASAAGQGSGTKADPYVLENGAAYSIKQFGSFYAKFTAPSAGKFVLTGDSYNVYKDETFSTIDDKITPKFNGDYENKEYSFDCEAGKTYYVGFKFAMGAYTTTFKFVTEAEPLQMKSCDPAEGTVMNLSSTSVYLKFNQNVAVGSCTVSCGTNTADLVINARDIYVSVDAKNVLLNWYNDNKIKEGDDITFTFSGIKSADGKQTYGEDGKFVVTYKAGAKPVLLVSSVNTPVSNPAITTFKSYYMEDDYSSVINLNFSGNIKEVGSVTLEYGSREPVGGKEELYIETLTPTIIANTVIVNLKGKLRRVQDMIPGATQGYEYITLAINGVKDDNGNLAIATDQANVGKFVFNYKYQEVAYEVASDIEEGNPVKSDTKNIKIWLQETGGNAVFSGASFAYKENGEDKTATIEGSLLSYENDEADADARFVIVPVPNVNIDAGSEVVLTLNGETPDGVGHNELTVTLNCEGKTADNTEFAVVSALWHDGENDVKMVDGNIAVLTRESKTTFTLNKEFGYCYWTITDNEGEYIRSGYYASPTPVTSFDVEWFGEKFIQGKTYTFTLKAWNKESEQQGAGKLPPTVGTATFTFNGAAEAYVYSDVVLQNYIADPYLLMNSEETTYTLEFSGPATVKKVILNEGQGMSSECEVKAVEGSNDQTWIVTIPASALSKSQILINVFAEDKEHRAINKALDYTNPTDGGDNVWLPITLEAEFNKPAFTVTPESEATLEKIDVITFSYDGAINLSYAISDKIKIMTNGGRTLLYELGFDDVKRPEGYEGTDKLCIVLDNPITEVGNYIIDVPSGFFNLGEQFEGGSNRATTIYYEIAAPHEGLAITANPAAGNVTEIPERIEFTATELSMLAYNSDMEPTLTDAAGNTYKVYFDYPTDWSKWNAVDVVLEKGAITAEGTYTLTIPAGALFNDSDGNYSNLEDIVITYIIGSETGIDNIVANAGGKVDVYTINGVSVLRNADAAAVKALKKGLYIINGKKVVIM